MLLDEGHWSKIPALLDEVWYVDVPDDLRQARLVARHRQFGRSQEAAEAWVQTTDEPNARRIAQGKSKADVIFKG